MRVQRRSKKVKHNNFYFAPSRACTVHAYRVTKGERTVLVRVVHSLAGVPWRRFSARDLRPVAHELCESCPGDSSRWFLRIRDMIFVRPFGDDYVLRREAREDRLKRSSDYRRPRPDQVATNTGIDVISGIQRMQEGHFHGRREAPPDSPQH